MSLTGTQQETYTALNWEAKLTTRSVRATPLTVVVAPSQRLDWSGSQSVGPPGWFDKLSRIFAVMRGLLTVRGVASQPAGLAAWHL